VRSCTISIERILELKEILDTGADDAFILTEIKKPTKIAEFLSPL